ncbi:translation initiation factor IF-2, partial [human gut metagenome]
QSVSVRREDNQVTVDTRTVDMNVDRFDARYDDLASTKNTENRRKPTPHGQQAEVHPARPAPAPAVPEGQA